MCSQTRNSCAKAFDNRSRNKNLKPKKLRGGQFDSPPSRLVGLSMIFFMSHHAAPPPPFPHHFYNDPCLGRTYPFGNQKSAKSTSKSKVTLFLAVLVFDGNLSQYINSITTSQTRAVKINVNSSCLRPIRKFTLKSIVLNRQNSEKI